MAAASWSISYSEGITAEVVLKLVLSFSGEEKSGTQRGRGLKFQFVLIFEGQFDCLIFDHEDQGPIVKYAVLRFTTQINKFTDYTHKLFKRKILESRLTNWYNNNGFVDKDRAGHVLSYVDELGVRKLQVGDQHAVLVPVSGETESQGRVRSGNSLYYWRWKQTILI